VYALISVSNLGKTAADTFGTLKFAFGREAMSRTQTFI
jgi:hypothetical protein